MTKILLTAMLVASALLLSAQEKVVNIYEEGDFAYGKVTRTGDITPVDTPAGKGFLLGGKGQHGYLRLFFKNFDSGNMFFSFWISPVKWTPADGKFHIFASAQASDKSGEFNLYRYGNPDPSNDGLGIAFNQTGGKTEPRQLVINFPNNKILWEKNSWHYFLIACSQEHIAFYLDGELVGMQQGTFPLGKTPEFRFGHSWGESDASILADIRIGRKTLSQEDVAAEYDRVMMKMEGQE